MLEVARAKFRAGEQVEFQPADATALPFADGSFDAVVCQFGIMFFPDKAKSCSRGLSACSPPAAATCSASGTCIATIRSAGSRIEVAGRFFPADPPQFYNVPFSCHQIDPIKELLIAAGFSGINAAVVSLEKADP